MAGGRSGKLARSLVIPAERAANTATRADCRTDADSARAWRAGRGRTARRAAVQSERREGCDCDERAPNACSRTREQKHGEAQALRLYSQEDFDARPPFTQPEILRANLAEVILRMKAFHLGRSGEDTRLDHLQRHRAVQPFARSFLCFDAARKYPSVLPRKCKPMPLQLPAL